MCYHLVEHQESIKLEIKSVARKMISATAEMNSAAAKIIFSRVELIPSRRNDLVLADSTNHTNIPH